MKAAERNDDAGEWIQRIPFQEWYSVQDVSIILSVGSTQVYGYLSLGSLVGYLVDGKKRIKHEDLVEYIIHRHEMEQPRDAIGTIERIVPVQRTHRAPREPAVVQAISRQTLAKAVATPQEEIPVGGLDLDVLDLHEDEVVESVSKPPGFSRPGITPGLDDNRDHLEPLPGLAGEMG